MEIKNILLPVDGSECRMRFLGMVKEMALAFGAEITILHVQDRYSSLPIQNMLETQFDVKKVKAVPVLNKKPGIHIINNIKKFLKGNGIVLHSRVEFGNPAEKIIDIAVKENFDIIIMCSHGISSSKKFLLGSVTNKVVHYASTPVLVIKHEFCKVIDLNTARRG